MFDTKNEPSREDGNSLNRKLISSCSALSVLILVSGMSRSTVSDSRTDARNREQAEKGIAVSHLRSPGEIERYVYDHNDEADLDAIWARFGVATASGPPGRCGCREATSVGLLSLGTLAEPGS